jgi:hypothetical protein
MLLPVLRMKNVDQMDILYFEFPISLLNRADVVFTDASANTSEPPNFYSDPADLVRLNWREIDSLKWSSANDILRHQRMAEVLVYSDLPVQDAVRVVVWNESKRKQVEELVTKAGVPFPAIEFASPERRHYFLKFMEGSRSSIVTGPKGIARAYASACEQIRQKKGQQANAPFETLENLLEGLREDFACLPHTAELVGLESENSFYRGTVDIDTLRVVQNLKTLRGFASLPREYQDHVELAAYLHDIGKGPKARWERNDGIQKVDPDHPVRAMPMMVEILTQQVRKAKQEDAELILKLVCYHDLVDEVLGKGRDKQQIVDVAKTELELDMLFALGRADATSLVKGSWDEDAAAALYNCCLAAIKARNDN